QAFENLGNALEDRRTKRADSVSGFRLKTERPVWWVIHRLGLHPQQFYRWEGSVAWIASTEGHRRRGRDSSNLRVRTSIGTSMSPISTSPVRSTICAPFWTATA